MVRLLIIFLLICSPVFAKTIPELNSNTSPSTSDLTYTVDVSDTTDGSSGTGKKATIAQVFKAANMTVNGTNVGINNTSPTTTLDVTGTVKATAFSGDGSGLTGITATAGGWTDGGITVSLTTSTDNVGIGTPSAQVKLDVKGDINSEDFISKLNIPSADTGDIDIGGYFTVPSAGADWGAGGSSEMHFLSAFYKARIRQDTTLTKVQFYVASKPSAVTAFYIEVWRYDSSTQKYDRISQEDVWSSVTAATLNTITLATPVTVKEGDTIGYGYTSSSNPGNFLNKEDSGTSVYNRQPNATYYTTGTTTADDFNWAGTTSSTDYMPIKLYSGTAPIVVWLGDSVQAGFNFSNSFLTKSITTTFFSPSGIETIPQRVCRSLGYTFQNMAISGEKTSEIAARITMDMTALKPRVMVFVASINDVQVSQDNAAYKSSVDTILDACINIGCKPVIFTFLPANSPLLSDSEALIAEAYDTILRTEASDRGLTVYDVKPYVGQFRTGGTAGNYWDWQNEYHDDEAHANNRGFEKIAEIMIQSINSVYVRGGIEAGQIRSKQGITFVNASSYGDTGYKTIASERVTGYEKPGVGIKIKGGNPSVLSKDENGGDIIISGGEASGTGKSAIKFETTYPGVTGTSETRAAEKVRITGEGRVAIATITPNSRVDIRSHYISPVENVTGHNLEDLTVGGTFTGDVSVNYFVKVETSGTPDTFRWSTDGGATWQATAVSMTGSAQTLNNGVTITWGATTGHTVDDVFTFSVDNVSPLYVKAGNNFDALYISPTGNVGVGSTNPGKTVDVQGTLRVSGGITGNASTATALAVDPSACSSGDYVSDIAANGTLTCGTPSGGGGANGWTDGGTEVFNTATSDNVGIGTTTTTSKLTVAGTITTSGTTAGSVVLSEASANGTDTITLSAPNSVGASKSFTLPSGYGSNGDVLTSDGSGGLSFTTPASGAGGWTDGGANVYTSTTTDNVGIGTTTPSTTLEIVKQSSNAPLMISSTAKGDGNYFIVSSSGNIGIGTTNTAFAGLSVMNGNVGIGTINPSNTFVVGANKFIVSAAGTITGITGASNASLSSSTLSFDVSGGTAIVNNNRSTSNSNLALKSGTGSGSYVSVFSANVERLRVDGNGNLGIGTLTPNSVLEVQSISSVPYFMLSTAGNTDGDVLIVNSSGNVGIGTTIPSAKAEIGGNASKIRMYDANGVGWSCGPAITTGVFTCS